MNSFIEEITQDIDWRYSELSILRTMPFRYGISNNHKDFLIKYSVPIIYSLWEGYVKNAFEIYIRELNKLNLDYKEVHFRILSHSISSEDTLSLRSPRVNFSGDVRFTKYLRQYLDKPLVIATKIPTASNIDFDVINDILDRFNLMAIPEDKFKSRLRKLLRFRNTVSHGDNSIPVKKEDIETFCATVSDLISEIAERIETGYKNKSYLKEPIVLPESNKSSHK